MIKYSGIIIKEWCHKVVIECLLFANLQGFIAIEETLAIK
jgi:hypothetical protein